MKLNKVLALALSGVMAVSMLAGCNGATSDGDEDTQVQPTTSNAVAVMNDAQDLVDFKADADFDAALAAAAKKATQGAVEDATYVVANAQTSDEVYKELGKKLPIGTPAIKSTDIDFSTITGSNKTTTQTVLYYVKNDGLTEKAALEQIADKMEDTMYPELVSSSSKNYKASYTGKVSVVTVETSDAGKTASAYYIAVSVTQTIARDAVV